MEKHMADMALDHVTFRIFLRKVLTNFYTKKEVNKKLNDQKWFLLDFINESILTALPYKDADGNILITKPVEELIGRVLYDAQTGELFQFRDDAEGNITTYVLFGEDLRDNQIVFLENMPTLEDSIYYMKDGKLESFLASHEHAGLMSAEDKEKLDSINPDDYLKEVSIEGTNLPKENGVVDIPKATNDDIDDDRASSKLYKLLETKARSLKNDPQKGLKLKRFALSRGYGYDEVSKMVDTILYNENDDSL